MPTLRSAGRNSNPVQNLQSKATAKLRPAGPNSAQVQNIRTKTSKSAESEDPTLATMDAVSADFAAEGTDLIDKPNGAAIEDTGVQLTSSPSSTGAVIQDAETNGRPSNLAKAATDVVGPFNLAKDTAVDSGDAAKEPPSNSTGDAIEDAGSFIPEDTAVDVGPFNLATDTAEDAGDAAKELLSNPTRAAMEDAGPLLAKDSAVNAVDAASGLTSNSIGAAIEDTVPSNSASAVHPISEEALFDSSRTLTEKQQDMTLTKMGNSKTTEIFSGLSNTAAGALAERPPQLAVVQDDSDCIIVIDLSNDEDTDDDAHSRPSKIQGSLKQARDSHLALTMKALDELGDQVLRRDGGKRTISDFLEVEKGATDQAIKSLKGILADVEEYGRKLKMARI